MDDLAEFRSRVEPSVSAPFAGLEVHACGFWCQGPVLAQLLRLVGATDVTRHRHNSPEYVHGLVEIIKLAFADRHAHYGDPDFVAVPAARLLSREYAQERVAMIRADKAWPGMPPAGMPASRAGAERIVAHAQPPLDTSYVCAVDAKGNVFSATPSDSSSDTPVIPGTGLCPSSRGSQSWADTSMAASVAPGKRPRLTPSPALALGPDGRAIAFGTPGGDVQAQAMLQVLLNRVAYGMDPQAAIEAPRFGSYSFPDSFEPHGYMPGRLALESRFPQDLADRLAALGHEIEWWPDWSWKAGAVCLIDSEPRPGLHHAGADPRRAAYALGW
jgi:gamma-glutamyltranspeptidase/glutathione hydrolase